MKRTPLQRTGRLPARSKKRQAIMPERRKMVARLLEATPWCEVPGCTQRSVDVHEPLTRARGGSIVDESNAKCVCRAHHDELGLEPAWGYELGFLVHSWDGEVIA